MSIQSNVSSALSLVSLLATQHPKAAALKAGKGYQATQEQAIRGLGDIQTNLEREEASATGKYKEGDPEYKKYNLEELKNIGERTRQYQRDIYDAKSAALNPDYKFTINPEQISQGDLSSQLSRIDEMRQRAMERLEAKTKEREASANFRKMFLARD